jgi:hypothetical protein
MWGFDQQLAALGIDIAALANWQRSGDKKAPKPPRIPRPGVDPDADQGDGVRRRRPKKASTRAEVDQRLKLRIGKK